MFLKFSPPPLPQKSTAKSFSSHFKRFVPGCPCTPLHAPTPLCQNAFCLTSPGAGACHPPPYRAHKARPTGRRLQGKAFNMNIYMKYIPNMEMVIGMNISRKSPRPYSFKSIILSFTDQIWYVLMNFRRNSV